MTEEFNYVIARPWDEDSDQLCCYMVYGNDVHYGTLENATATLDYINQKEEDEPDDYRIYKVVPL